MMKSKKIIIMMLFIISFCLSMIGITGGISVAAFDNDVKNGVVPIVLCLKDADIYISDGTDLQLYQKLGDCEFTSGTGFFIGDSDEEAQYIVTNAHVVEDYVTANEGGEFAYLYGYDSNGLAYIIYATSCELRVYFDTDDYEAAYVVDGSLGDSEKVDLAVLKLRNPTTKRHRLDLMEPTEDMVGDTVYTVGFPGNADNDFTSSGMYSVNDVIVYKGSITKFSVNAGKGVERIAIDAVVDNGNSGGPVVTADGKVIGVCTNIISSSVYRDTQDQPDYYAINTTELISFLDRNIIPPPPPEPWWYKYYLITLRVLPFLLFAVVVLIVMTVVQKKKNRNTAGNK